MCLSIRCIGAWRLREADEAAWTDVEEAVVARVLGALTSLCELGLFQKMRIWELMSATLGFLYHPNVWIRQGLSVFCARRHRRPE